MNEAQIRELEKMERLTVYFVLQQYAGYISSIDAREGDYITEGGLLMQLADISTLWV
jgi:Cu(I)/Ag(I) efflux system membrane fusion protein